MPPLTYAELNAQIQQYFQNAEYAQALELVTREGPRFPNDRPLLDYFRMCAAARVNNYLLAYAIIGAALEAGTWYGEAIWRQSPSFQPLQGLPEFERLVEASRQIQAKEAAAGLVCLTRLPERHNVASPLLLALHGNTSTAQATLPFWQKAVEHGWVLAAPQSSHAMYKGAFVWADHASANADVQNHLAALRQQITFDPTRLVVAGHSMGGEIAIWLALSGAVPARGFVTIGPGGPFIDEPEQWQPLIASARGRGYFIVGQRDDLILPNAIRRLAEMLNAAGIPAEVESVPQATHDFTPAYEAALLRGLAFVESA